jgi:hypothetical protein
MYSMKKLLETKAGKTIYVVSVTVLLSVVGGRQLGGPRAPGHPGW